MVQSAAADRVAHPSDRSIAWEETKGGSSSGPESEGLWPQCPPPSPEQMSQTNCTPLAQFSDMHSRQPASALPVYVHTAAGVSFPGTGLGC